LAHASSTAEESFGNIVTVRSFSNEGKMIAHYSINIDKSYGLGRKLAFLIGAFMGTVSMFMYVSGYL
jgi:ABC-type multidrug transport system fused ATPase/permease subunit